MAFFHLYLTQYEFESPSLQELAFTEHETIPNTQQS